VWSVVADSMAASGLSFRNTLVGSGWATSVLLCMNAPCMAAISSGEAFPQSGRAVAGQKPSTENNSSSNGLI